MSEQALTFKASRLLRDTRMESLIALMAPVIEGFSRMELFAIFP